jgi:hypothetical protein
MVFFKDFLSDFLNFLNRVFALNNLFCLHGSEIPTFSLLIHLSRPGQERVSGQSGINVLVSAVRNHHVVISEGKFIFMDPDLNVLLLVMIFHLKKHSFHIVSCHIYLPSLYTSVRWTFIAKIRKKHTSSNQYYAQKVRFKDKKDYKFTVVTTKKHLEKSVVDNYPKSNNPNCLILKLNILKLIFDFVL